VFVDCPSRPTRAFASAVLWLSVACWGVACASYSGKSLQTQQRATPQISVSASALNFQTLMVGQKTTQTLRVANTGNAALEISALSLSSQQYSISGPTLPTSIPASSSASYTVTFAPTAAGSTPATLNISSNATNNLGAISLVGSGEKAFVNLVVTPGVLSFGKVDLKSTSTQNVTLQNTGDVSLTLQGVTVAGGGFGYSDLSPGYTLTPNQTVTFQVWFAPKAAGVATGTLTLLSANLASPGTLDLSGDGVSGSSSPTPPPTTSPSSSPASVVLHWNGSTSQVVGYNVYRSVSSDGVYNLLIGNAVNALTYTDTTVSSGSTYYYVVTAVDPAGVESGYSNQTSAAVPAS
jgi:Abnormal spindle-like microcephaly-assoc'd, ASPM-SPD-2-Hydin